MRPKTVLTFDLDAEVDNPQHDTDHVEVPRHLVGMVEKVVESARHQAHVCLVLGDRELSPNAAADVLGVSRPHLMKLLERGRIDHRRVGRDYRIAMGDLVDYIQEQEGLRAQVEQASVAAQQRADEAVRAAADVDDEAAHKLGL